MKEPGEHEYKKLCALSETLFVIEGNEGIRAEFEMDDHDKAVAINAILAEGSKRRVARTAAVQKGPGRRNEVKGHDTVEEAGTVEVDDSICTKLGIEFVRIDGGTYQMGDSFGEGSRTEIPLHEVTIDDYYMSKTEVTFAQYDRFCEETSRKKPIDQGWGRGNNPVVNVSWDDAVAFCAWISRKSGTPIRLPTESEWEYAAREGGKKIRFGNGKDIADTSEINFDGSDEHKKVFSTAGENRQRTVPVKSISPNGLDLYHMSGNVWEWCSDWYEREYYRHSTNKNPTGPENGTYRVIRGGSWMTGPGTARCSARGAFTPTDGTNMIGFRLVYRERSR